MNKIKSFFIKFWEFLKKFHWYGWVGIVVTTGYLTLCYTLSHVIVEASGRTVDAIIPKIDAIDNLFPLIPFFIIIYWFSYVFWGFCILATALTKKDNFINMIIAAVIAGSIGFIILVSYPTYIDRVKEGTVEVFDKPGFLNWWLAQTYLADGGKEYGWSLLPSFHCLNSLVLALGTFRRKDSPLWWRIIVMISLVLISLSALFTKQHYFIDVVAGLGIAAIVTLLVKLINPGKYILEKLEARKLKNENKE